MFCLDQSSCVGSCIGVLETGWKIRVKDRHEGYSFSVLVVVMYNDTIVSIRHVCIPYEKKSKADNGYGRP